MALAASAAALVASAALTAASTITTKVDLSGLLGWLVQHVPPGRALAVAAVAAAMAVASALVWFLAGREQRPYIKGNWPPPRNVVA
jgi:hypothetical protein